ncbi:hypothetical protein Tco_1553950 [Tanacetum coccineum]
MTTMLKLGDVHRLELEAATNGFGLIALNYKRQPYTSFGDRNGDCCSNGIVAAMVVIALYLAVMIFRLCCVAANSGRMAECENCSPQQPPRAQPRHQLV